MVDADSLLHRLQSVQKSCLVQHIMWFCVQADSEWLRVVPWGLRKLLVWIDQRYNHPDIYVLENGVDCPQESNLPLSGKAPVLCTQRPCSKHSRSSNFFCYPWSYAVCPRMWSHCMLWVCMME